MEKALKVLLEELSEKPKIDGIAIVVASNKGKHSIPSQLNVTLLGDISYEQIISVATAKKSQ